MTTNTLYVMSLPTPWLCLKKTVLTHAWRFRRTNKKSPLKSPFFGGILPKICMICTFRWEDRILLRKWLTMHIWKQKIVWSGNNGCHVSQEDVCKWWVALYPAFTDAYSKIRIPEQGKNAKVCKRLVEWGDIRSFYRTLSSIGKHWSIETAVKWRNCEKNAADEIVAPGNAHSNRKPDGRTNRESRSFWNDLTGGGHVLEFTSLLSTESYLDEPCSKNGPPGRKILCTTYSDLPCIFTCDKKLLQCKPCSAVQ